MNKEYMQGFIDKCAELGVDPDQLAKNALSGGKMLNYGIKRTGQIFKNKPEMLGKEVRGLTGKRLHSNSTSDYIAKAFRDKAEGNISGMHGDLQDADKMVRLYPTAQGKDMARYTAALAGDAGLTAKTRNIAAREISSESKLKQRLQELAALMG